MIFSKKSFVKVIAVAMTIVITVTSGGAIPFMNSSDTSDSVYAAEKIDITAELEKYANDSEEVLKGFSKELSENYGPRLYGTKLQTGGANYFIDELKKYGTTDVGILEARTHYNLEDEFSAAKRSDRFPGVLYPFNHRIHGVVELSENASTWQDIAVGRAIPAYDDQDYSEYKNPLRPGIGWYGTQPQIPEVSTSGKFLDKKDGGFSGTFVDFGVLDPNDPSALNLPADNEITGDVYGSIRLATPTQGSVTTQLAGKEISEQIGKLETTIKAIDGVKDLTGLYMASSAENPVKKNPHNGSDLHLGGQNRSANFKAGILYATSDVWKDNTSVSAISMTLSELEKVVASSDSIEDSYRLWPDTDYTAYGRIPAETNDPDLVLLLSGHLDGVTASPSVVDDGGAIASMVEIARRLQSIDNGNIEIIFTAVGGEEHSDFNGMYKVVDELLDGDKDYKDRTIHLCMDQISSADEPMWNDANGTDGNNMWRFNQAWGFDEENNMVGMTLPLNLTLKNFVEFGAFKSQPDYVTKHAISRSSVPGNDNAATTTEYIENFNLGHDSNYQYHTSLDTMDNYGLERHQYATDIIHAAVLRAIRDQVSKRAEFDFETAGSKTEVTLRDADTMFKTYDKISAEVVGKTNTTPEVIEFTPGKATVSLPADDYEFVTESKTIIKTTKAETGFSATAPTDGVNHVEADKTEELVTPKVYGYHEIDIENKNLSDLNFYIDDKSFDGNGLANGDSQPVNPVSKSPLVAEMVKSTKSDIAGSTLTGVKSKVYNGKAQTQNILVKYNGMTLLEGTDYTVTYKNNTKVGKSNVTVNGIGKYYGSKSIDFNINPKKTSVSKIKVGKKKATVTWKKVSGTTKYQVRYKKSSSKKWKVKTVSAKNSKLTVKKLTAGKKYQFQVRSYKTVDKAKYYSAWSKTKTSKKVKRG